MLIYILLCFFSNSFDPGADYICKIRIKHQTDSLDNSVDSVTLEKIYEFNANIVSQTVKS